MHLNLLLAWSNVLRPSKLCLVYGLHENRLALLTNYLLASKGSDIMTSLYTVKMFMET